MLLYTFFFFNDTATTEIYTLSLHDALPILKDPPASAGDTRDTSLILALEDPLEKEMAASPVFLPRSEEHTSELQSPNCISYAVFCLKKKKQTNYTNTTQHV